MEVVARAEDKLVIFSEPIFNLAVAWLAKNTVFPRPGEASAWLPPVLLADLREQGSRCSHHSEAEVSLSHTETHPDWPASLRPLRSKGHGSVKWEHLMPPERRVM
ncbi:hypothetical protein MHYP_G00254700 [Metynnis hypsauchen]